MKLTLLLAASTLLLGGCGALVQDLGAAGKAPGELACMGRAEIAVSGNLAASLGISATNEFRVAFDCGDGAFIRQGPPPPRPN